MKTTDKTAGELLVEFARGVGAMLAVVALLALAVVLVALIVSGAILVLGWAFDG